MNNYYFDERQRSAFTFSDNPEGKYKYLNQNGEYILPPIPTLNYCGHIEHSEIEDLQSDLSEVVRSFKDREPKDGDFVNVLRISAADRSRNDQYVFADERWVLYISDIGELPDISFIDIESEIPEVRVNGYLKAKRSLEVHEELTCQGNTYLGSELQVGGNAKIEGEIYQGNSQVIDHSMSVVLFDNGSTVITEGNEVQLGSLEGYKRVRIYFNANGCIGMTEVPISVVGNGAYAVGCTWQANDNRMATYYCSCQISREGRLYNSHAGYFYSHVNTDYPRAYGFFKVIGYKYD